MRLPGTFVVDASVGVKLFLEEDGSDEAERLFALLGREPAHVVAVPELFFIECANVFRSRVHRRLMSAGTAREAFAILRSLPLQTVSSSDLVSEALDLALAHGLSVYDGIYAALAERLEVPLVTADGRLRQKLGKAGVTVFPLTNQRAPNRLRLAGGGARGGPASSRVSGGGLPERHQTSSSRSAAMTGVSSSK